MRLQLLGEEPGPPNIPLNQPPQVSLPEEVVFALSGFNSFSISITTSWNALATLSLCLADASVNAHPNFAANASPSSRLTVLHIGEKA